MIEHSTELGELAAALSKAQAEIKGAIRGSENPYFQSRYADLSSVRDACLPALNSHGLSVIQAPYIEGQAVGVTTMLLHTSGQWLRGRVAATPKDLSPQSVGSATTYLRRYALAAIAGVAPEDDDGEAAQPRESERLTTDREVMQAFPEGIEKQDDTPDPRPGFVKGEKKCPYCHKSAVIKGKAEYGGGWLCFGKRGGCGQKWPELAAPTAKVVDTETGEVATPRDPEAVKLERQALVLKARKLAAQAGLGPQDFDRGWVTYCGTATETNVDPGAAAGFVAWLETRCAK